MVGIGLYFMGFLGIIYHDSILRNLRRSGGGGPRYKIPYGGLFNYATSAQYFTELVAWFGFFLMSWGPNGLFIFLISLGNLSVRARRTQEWFKNKFEDYPKDRKILIPFVC
eukprot:UN14262